MNWHGQEKDEKKCKNMNWQKNRTHVGFVYCSEMNTIPAHPDYKGRCYMCVQCVFNTHNTHRNTQPRKGGVICVYNVFGLRPRYLQSSRLVKPPLQFKPCPIFWPLFQTDSKQYPFCTVQHQNMYWCRNIGLSWQIGIGTSCRSLIRGKGWEGKTNNQLESPLRFNGTHTQVPWVYTGCTGI